MDRSHPPTPPPVRPRGPRRSTALWPLILLLLISGCASQGGVASVAPSLAPTDGSTSAAATSVTAGPTTAASTPAPSAAGTPSPAPATTAPAPTAPAPTAQTSPSPSAAAGFPRTLTDDEGTVVAIPAEPQHIVSLTPATTETLFALGAGDRVVGGTDADDYPAEAKALPDVATFQGVQVEKVVDLKTDLVIAGGNNFNPPADLKRLRDLGIPVVVLYAESVDEVLADIRLIGDAVGAGAAAQTITDAMRQRIDTIAAAANHSSPPRVFYQIGSAPDIYGPADASFVADIIALAGGSPITTGDKVSYTMPLERLVTSDPQVIIVADANYGVTPAEVKARGGVWSAMTAVKNDAVRPVDDILVTRPGPRLADGLLALARAIDPALIIPGESPAPSPSVTASP